MARNVEGLKSEAMLAALEEALTGRSARLEDLLARHGGLPGPKPNLKLAQAFGTEVGPLPGELMPLLTRLADEDAAPDTARAYLPVAAAHALVGRLRAGREVEPAFRALFTLAADERSPVRVGTVDALITLGSRNDLADELVRRGHTHVTEEDDRELCFGAAALVVEALGDPRVLACIGDSEALLAYVASVIDRISSAPRSAERSDGRRRALTSLARSLPPVVMSVRADDRGKHWLEAECERAKHPDIRRALSDAIVRLAAQGHSLGGTAVEELRKSLEGSAKPLRDPTLVRPGTGRGKSSRRTR
jgi:hypothetical protein